MSKIDKKAIIEEEHKRIFAKPIVTENPTFDSKQIEDFWTLFNLYADNRRQADMREIVTTAKTLGYDQTHEYIFHALCDIADQMDGEWIGFEQFLEMLTHAIVLLFVARVTARLKRAGERPSRCWTATARAGSPSTPSRRSPICSS
jgi:hypothetical protein